MDVVVDTDILSTFLKTRKLRLLTRLFAKSRILVCPSVNSEIRRGVGMGVLRYSRKPALTSIRLSKTEREIARELGEDRNLGSGDAECLAVARHRKCLLLTNDRKVGKAADSASIEHLNLPLVLREIWKNNVIPKSRVFKLMEEIEQKDNVVIKNKELIFS